MEEIVQAGQAVELGEDHGGTNGLRVSQRLGELRTVAAFAALRFDVLGNECPSAPIEVALYSRTLRFQTKTTAALLVCADTQ